MNIIYISYWGINDGLSQSTVLPNIEILSNDNRVKKIFLFTFERGEYVFDIDDEKVSFHPIIESSGSFGLNKFQSFIKGWKQLKKLFRSVNTIDLVIGRSVFAGILAYHIKRKYNIPFVIESYEPHVDYMEESMVWKPNGIKSRIVNRYDRLVREHAKYLVPVAKNYRDHLLDEGLMAERLEVVPCTVSLSDFELNLADRVELRKRLGIDPEMKVGVYVGKFGGIYYKEKAFELFSEFKRHLGDKFYMIILTPDNRDEVLNLARSNDLEEQSLFVNKVPHRDIPKYLSAADFAFATIKPAKSRIYCSPIKTGEYMANGLPLIITKNVGDDDKLVEKFKIGCVWDSDLESVESVTKSFLKRFGSFNRTDPTCTNDIINVAKSFRSRKLNRDFYKQMLDSFQ